MVQTLGLDSVRNATDLMSIHPRTLCTSWSVWVTSWN